MIFRPLNVRAFLGLAFTLSPLSQGLTQPVSEPFDLKAIGPGVYAAIDGPAGKSGSNAGFVIGDDGVLVIDSFYSPEATRALLARIHALTPKPVRYVVNTHYHIDHVGGDAVFREAGAVIIAHRNVRGWIRRNNPHLLGDHPTPAQQAMIDALPLPDVVTDKGLTIWLGTRRVEVRAVLGHTGGDLVVSVPDAKVLFCGDMLWRRVSPNVIDGTVSQWIDTLGAFASAPDAGATTFVPGHGDVAALVDVEALRAYFTDLSSWTKAARATGLTGAALTAEVLPKMKARYGPWAAFDYFAPREIGFMDAELAGTKIRPAPVPD